MAGLEKLCAHSCPCTCHARKSSLTYTKKRVCKLFNEDVAGSHNPFIKNS